MLTCFPRWGRSQGYESCSCFFRPIRTAWSSARSVMSWEFPNSTLSHHLEKLKNEDLVTVRREGTFLWYSANTEALEELLGFLYAECCTRNKAIEPRKIVSV